MKIKHLIEGVFQKRISSLRKMGYMRRRYAARKDLLSLQQAFSKSIREGNKKAFGGMVHTVQAIKLEHAQLLLETQGVNVLERYWSKLRSEQTRTARQLLNNKDVSAAMLLTQDLVSSGSSHPKMAKLCSIVGEQFAFSAVKYPRGQDGSAIGAQHGSDSRLPEYAIVSHHCEVAVITVKP